MEQRGILLRQEPIKVIGTVRDLRAKENNTVTIATALTEIPPSASPGQNGVVAVLTPDGSGYATILTSYSIPMLTSFLYFFTFSSWGLGLFSAFMALSMRLQKHSLEVRKQSFKLELDAIEVEGKKALISRMIGGGGSIRISRGGIPEEIKNLMEQSPNHPEVTEINEDDQIQGIVFKAQSYPPTPSDDSEDS